MSIDERVSAQLSELTEDLIPMPDPLGRLKTRYQRVKRRRFFVTSALCFALVVAGGTTVLWLRQPALPPAVTAQEAGDSMLQWAEKLADGPTMGAVGQDAAYVAAFKQSVSTIQSSAGYPEKRSVREIKVPFVEDIGSHRVAFVVFALTVPLPGSEWPNTSAWFAAPKGASPEELSKPESIKLYYEALEPLEKGVIQPSLSDDSFLIALSPPGCQFSTAPMPEVTDWRPEPTGRYLVRPTPHPQAEWWRITCDGVVREEVAGSYVPTGRPSLTDAEFAAATANTRGQFDPARVRLLLTVLNDQHRYPSHPYLLWSGRIDGTEPDLNGHFDGQANIVVGRAFQGWWTGWLSVTYDTVSPSGHTGLGESFTSYTDPTDPSIVLPIRLGTETSNVLVIAPAGAVTVRAGGVTATVTDAAAFLKVPDPASATYEALDASGKVIGSAKLAKQGAKMGGIRNW